MRANQTNARRKLKKAGHGGSHYQGVELFLLKLHNNGAKGTSNDQKVRAL